MSAADYLARHIRSHRGRLLMTQDDLARKMAELGFGWTRTTVAKVEMDGPTRRGVDVDELVALSLILGQPVGLLVRP